MEKVLWQQVDGSVRIVEIPGSRGDTIVEERCANGEWGASDSTLVVSDAYEQAFRELLASKPRTDEQKLLERFTIEPKVEETRNEYGSSFSRFSARISFDGMFCQEVTIASTRTYDITNLFDGKFTLKDLAERKAKRPF